MTAYCDSNLLVRVYAELPESERALAQLQQLRLGGAKPVPITWLHQIELANAFEQLVFLARSGQGVRMSTQQAAVALASFNEDLSAGNGFVADRLGALELVREARQLSLRHTARLGFRSYDVIHVASALLLECDAFWSFDAKANKLAALEGLRTL